MNNKDRENISWGVGTGWYPILDNLVSDLRGMGWQGKILQVKEKFGGLRFYIDQGSEAIDKRIAQAEAQAAKTCEMCGSAGTRVGQKSGWLKTLCSDCKSLRDANYNRN